MHVRFTMRREFLPELVIHPIKSVIWPTLGPHLELERS